MLSEKIIVMALVTDLQLFLIFWGIRYGLKHVSREQSGNSHLHLLLFFILHTQIIYLMLKEPFRPASPHPRVVLSISVFVCLSFFPPSLPSLTLLSFPFFFIPLYLPLPLLFSIVWLSSQRHCSWIQLWDWPDYFIIKLVFGMIVYINTESYASRNLGKWKTVVKPRENSRTSDPFFGSLY